MTRLRPSTLLLATCWLLLCAFWGAEALAQNPEECDSCEELLVELRAGQLVQRTVLAISVDEVAVLLPAYELFDLLEMDASVDSLGRLVTTRYPERIQIGVDVRGNVAWVDEEILPLGEVALWWDDQELYLEAELIARLLDVDAYVDLAELTVTFDPVDRLPVGRRMQRERWRNTQVAAADAPPPDYVVGPDLSAWQGAVLGWSLSVPHANFGDGSAWSFALGSGVWGGGLDLRLRGRSGNEAEELVGSWEGAWPRAELVKQMRVGRVMGTGPRARGIDGLSITNAPYVRTPRFGETILDGWLEPGWEVEVYRQGRLIDYTRSDPSGYYSIAIPIDYGQNPVEVRAYGPHGELRVLQRAIRVDFDRLPPGRLEYGLSGGRCQGPDCDETATLDLRYGVDPDWTLRGGLDAFLRKDQEDLWHPYAALSGSIRNSWLLQAESVLRAFHSLRFGYEPSYDLRGGLEQIWYEQRVSDPVLSPLGDRDLTRASLFWRPYTQRRSFFVGVDGSRRGTELGSRWRLDTSLTAQLGRLRTNLQWRSQWERLGPFSHDSSAAILSASTVLPSSSLAILNGLFLRGTLRKDIRSNTQDGIAIQLGRRLSGSARLELGASWEHHQAGPLLMAGLVQSGSFFHSSSQLSRRADGSTSSFSLLEGSALWNGSSERVEAYPFRSNGRGGVSGTVFEDLNGNGWKDPDEPGVAGVRLEVGFEFATTDAEGHYSIWNLVPFELTDLSVDPHSLRDPLIMPRFELASVAILPNGFREVDLPMVRGREVMGSVHRSGASQPVPLRNVPVELRSVDGRTRLTARSFHDGEFYLVAVPPGEYIVTVNEGWLRRNGMHMSQASWGLKIPFDAVAADPPPLELRLRWAGP